MLDYLQVTLPQHGHIGGLPRTTGGNRVLLRPGEFAPIGYIPLRNETSPVVRTNLPAGTILHLPQQVTISDGNPFVVYPAGGPAVSVTLTQIGLQQSATIDSLARAGVRLIRQANGSYNVEFFRRPGTGLSFETSSRVGGLRYGVVFPSSVTF